MQAKSQPLQHTPTVPSSTQLATAGRARTQLTSPVARDSTIFGVVKFKASCGAIRIVKIEFAGIAKMTTAIAPSVSSGVS